MPTALERQSRLAAGSEVKRDLWKPRANCSASRRPFAPFAREVCAAIEAGENPNVYLFCGSDAWDRARLRREQHGPGSALVLPAGADPAALRWPAVDALVVDAGALTGAEREKLAHALMRDGVRFACLIFDGGAINVRASWSKQVAA